MTLLLCRGDTIPVVMQESRSEASEPPLPVSWGPEGLAFRPTPDLLKVSLDLEKKNIIVTKKICQSTIFLM